MFVGCDIIVTKQSSSFERKMSTPSLYLEVLFVWMDKTGMLQCWNCTRHSWETSPREGEDRCVCVCMCGMHIQYNFFVGKTGCAMCAFLKWAAATAGECNCHHGNWNGNNVKDTKDLLALQNQKEKTVLQRGSEQDVFFSQDSGGCRMTVLSDLDRSALNECTVKQSTS